MGGSGHISAMHSSLRTNNRRKQRQRFKKDDKKWKAEKTTYNVPTVSEFKRNEIVEKIIHKRKNLEAVGYAVMVFLVCLVIFWVIWSHYVEN